jgi:hypothetical protein
MFKSKKFLCAAACIMATALADCDDHTISNADLLKVSMLEASLNPSYDKDLLVSEAKNIESSVINLCQAARVQINIPAPKEPNSIVSNLYKGTWHGPEAGGWYTSHVQVMGYSQTLKIRKLVFANGFEYQLTITYDGVLTDFSYQDHLYITMDAGGLVSGYYYMNEKNSEASVPVQEVDWKFDFSNWDPPTGAGTFTWAWGVDILSGSVADYQQSLKIVSTATGSPSLHTDVTWYALNGTVLGMFSYDSSIVPAYISSNLFNY